MRDQESNQSLDLSSFGTKVSDGAMQVSGQAALDLSAFGTPVDAAGPDLARPEPSAREVSENGFLDRRIDDAQRGWHRSMQGLDIQDLDRRTGTSTLLDQIDAGTYKEPVERWERLSEDPRAKQYRLAGPEERAQIRQTLRGAIDEDITDLVSAEQKINQLPQSDEARRFGEAEDFGSAWDALADAPVEVISSLATESLGQQSPYLPLMAIHPALGAGAGSYITEKGADIINSLREAGVDFSSKESIREGLSNPEQMAAFRQHAARRGLAVGLVDAISGGLAGKYAAGATTTLSRIGRGAVEDLVMQPALGAAGEAVGAIAAGDEISGKELLAEAAGEIGPGAVETTVGTVQNVRRRGNDTGPDGAPVVDDIDAETGERLALAAPVSQEDGAGQGGIRALPPSDMTYGDGFVTGNFPDLPEPDAAQIEYEQKLALPPSRTVYTDTPLLEGPKGDALPAPETSYGEGFTMADTVEQDAAAELPAPDQFGRVYGEGFVAGDDLLPPAPGPNYVAMVDRSGRQTGWFNPETAHAVGKELGAFEAPRRRGPTIDEMMKDGRSADEIRAELVETSQQERAAADVGSVVRVKVPGKRTAEQVRVVGFAPDATVVETRDGQKIALSDNQIPQPEQLSLDLSNEQPRSAVAEDIQSNRLAAEIEQAAQQAQAPVSEAQAEAGNYRKGHVKVSGLDIAIENPRGSTRSGTDASGKSWSVEMPAHYGYIKRTEGADGDHVDVYVGPEPDSENVYVIDQIDHKTGKFDEHKVMIGYPTSGAAQADYRKAFNDGRGILRIGAITPMTVSDFKDWLKSANTKKPVTYLDDTAGETNADTRGPIMLNQEDIDKLTAVLGGPHGGKNTGYGRLYLAMINSRRASSVAEREAYENAMKLFARFGDQRNVTRSSTKSENKAQVSEKTNEDNVTGSRGDKIEDFGEVLAGARKHYADILKDAKLLDIAEVPLSQSWPQPDYGRMLEDGIDPDVVAFIHAARDEVPNKPRASWKLKGWVSQVEQLRSFADDLVSGDITVQALREKLAEKERISMLFADLRGRMDLYKAVGHDQSLKGIHVSHGTYSVFGGIKYDPPKSIWMVAKDVRATAFGNWPRQLATGDTREDAIANFKKAYPKLKLTDQRKETSFTIYSYRRGPKSGKTWIGKKIGRHTVDLKSFDNVKDARSFLAENRDELIALLNDYKHIPEHRTANNSPRVGIDHRNGADVTPEQFAEMFGFRGVQFGNYVENSRRQQDLNEAYDAFLDLAAVLDVSPKALSLNGEMGLAFGARGKGGKNAGKAHYEPGEVVINLTKHAGAGSLAHEWWHGLDNYFERKRGRRTKFMTDSPWEVFNDQTRQEMIDAFAGVMKAIKSTDIKKRSAELDNRRTKPYWSTDIEMSARSFEAYIIAKLQDQGAANDYLANIVSESAYSLKAGYPYPTQSELAEIRVAFDHFFDTIEQRETDNGVELYRLADQKSEKRTQLEEAVVAEIKRLAPDVKVEIRKNGKTLIGGKTADAGYIPVDDLIWTAMDAADPTHAGRHEVVHHLRATGRLTEAEWSILERKAKSTWRKQYRVEDYREQYAGDADIETVLDEEAVAEAFADWMEGGSDAKGGVARIFRKIKQFFDRIASVVRGQGYKSAEDVFRSIDDGEVGKRATNDLEKMKQQRAEYFAMSGLRKKSGSAAAKPKQKASPLSDAQEAAIKRTMANIEDEQPMAVRVRETLVDAVDYIKHGAVQHVFDQFDSIKRYEKATYGELKRASMSAYKMARLTTNLQSTMAAVLRHGPLEYKNGAFQVRKGFDGGFEAIFADLSDRGLLKAWKGWAVANRAARLAREGRENNMTAQDIALLKDLDKQYPEFRDVMKRWTAFNKAMLDMAEQTGLLDPDARALFEHDDYVPFYRAIDDTPTGPFRKKGLANQRSGINRLKGGEAEVNDLIDNMVRNMTQLVDASMKNVAAKRVLRTLKTAGLDDGSVIMKVPHDSVPVHVTPEEAAQALENIGVQVQGMTKQQHDQWLKLFTLRPPKDPDVVSVMVGGKPQYFRVNDPLLLASMTSLGTDRVHWLVSILGYPKRWLTTGVTATPGFMLRNFIRDSLHGWVVSGEKFRPGIDGFKGAIRSYREDTALVNIMAAGGGSGGFFRTQSRDVAKMLSSVHGKNAIIDSPKKAWEWWKRVGQATENANRLAIYDSVLKDTGDVAEAAYQALDIMDFSMRGDSAVIRFLIGTIPFLNARMQGLYRLGRGMKQNPKAFMLRGGLITAATMLLYSLNADDDRYDELPEWEKDAYYHIFLDRIFPEEALEAAGIPFDEFHVRLPKPFEVGALFSTIPERATRLAQGKDDLSKYGERMWSMLRDTFAVDLPQFVKPLAEQWANEVTFTGSPIIPERMQDLEPEAQYDARTSELAKQIGDALPDFMGDAKSPKRIEAAVRAFFGSYGVYVMGIADEILDPIVGNPVEPDLRGDQMPEIGSFIRQQPYSSTRFVSEFYDLKREIEAVAKTYKQYRSQGQIEDAKDITRDGGNKKIAMAGWMRRKAKQMSGINKQIRSVEESRSLTSAQKRNQIDRLSEQRNELAEQVVKALNKAGIK